MKDKKIGLFSLLLLALLALVLALATLYEHLNGSARAGFFIYNSVWFTLLWLLAATMGCYYIAVKSLQKRFSVFLLHLSFLIILFGALTTRIAGKTGHVHLREDRRVDMFLDEWTHSVVILPFSLSLKSFEIEYYPGTDSPANYVSVVELTDSKTGERFEREISMNNILRYKGYRFYQSSFDEDRQGTILSVNRDIIGITISYIGYYLMFLSMLLILLDKRERFRFLLKKLAPKPAIIAILIFIPVFARAKSQPPPQLLSDSMIVCKDMASNLGGIWVEYLGRISPVQTLANDFTVKITGKKRYNNISGEQFFFGWLLFYEKWRQEPIFKLKSEELKLIAGANDGKASLADFFDANGRNKLEPYYRQMYAGNRTKGWINEAVKLNDKFYLIEMLQNGSLLKILPMQNDDGKLQWYAPENDGIAAIINVDRLREFQQKNAGDTLPSTAIMKMEKIYNRLQIFSLLFMICLTAGSLGLLFFIFKDSKIQRFKDSKIQRFFVIALWVVFVMAAIGLVMRTCIGGRFPLSNTYETMLLLSWFSLLTGILMRRYSFLLVIFSFLLSGFTLLVAHIGSMNPQITPLVPVLNSPWLSIHVLTIMTSYGLCGFMTFNSITAFIVWLTGIKKKDNIAEYIKQLKETNELLMYPATFLMGAGIFIGAIWANVSWGRYWGWDPKEVWALITFMLMGLTFHEKTLAWLRKPLVYHIFVVIIFLSVLMTYFGVNYLLGGRHSYA